MRKRIHFHFHYDRYIVAWAYPRITIMYYLAFFLVSPKFIDFVVVSVQLCFGLQF